MSWDVIKNLTATKKRSFIEQLYRLYIKRVRLLNIPRVTSPFVAIPQDHFRAPMFLPFAFFGVANFIKNRFVDIIAQLLFTKETFEVNLTFLDVVDLRVARVPTCNNDALLRSHCYENVAASSLEHTIGAKYLQILKRKEILFFSEQLQYPRSPLALHCTRSVMNLVQILKPSRFVFFLPLQSEPLFPFRTQQGPSKIVTRLVASPFNIVFALLLVGKCHFVLSRVPWLNSLSESKGGGWMSL